MAWVKGSDYWLKLKDLYSSDDEEDLFGFPDPKGGAPKKIKSPGEMWRLFCEYCADVDGNPAEKAELIKTGDYVGSTFGLDVQRPYLWSGFESYLAIRGIIATVKEYKQNRTGSYSDFSHVMLAIDKIIETQNFEGAAMKFFDPNLIARRLGLADKQELKADVNDDGIDYSKLSDAALEEINKARVSSDWNAGL